jgi:hypothetical protein
MTPGCRCGILRSITPEEVKEMNIRRGIVVIAALLIGVAIGIPVSRAVGLAGGAEVEVLEGYAWVNEGGTAIGLSPDGKAAGPGYVIAGAMWREQSGPWHDTFPTCLQPLATGQKVRMGVLDAPPEGQAPGRPVVVWLECLDE